MLKRTLGRTGHESTVAIFGGAALGESTEAEAHAALDMAEAAGVNHIDIAPTYGHAEAVTGPWLESRRDKFFVGCKTGIRDREGSWEELHASLKRLRTDKFDLYQLHAVTNFDELDAAMKPGGAIETLKRARDEGLTKWLGITGHGIEVAAVQAKALELFDFDTVMFPLNPVLYANPKYRADAERLLAMCAERNVGVQIIKSIAKGPWADRDKATYNTWYEPFDQQERINEGVHFALSQHPVAAIAIAGDTRLLPMVIKAADSFAPMSDEAQAALIERAEELEPLFT